MIGVLAELERSLTSNRNRAGVTAAKCRRREIRAQAELTPQQIEHARKLINGDASLHDVAASYHVSRATLYRTLAAK
jgi:DNA invertase Pin-like site-specific DNA recombinase